MQTRTSARVRARARASCHNAGGDAGGVRGASAGQAVLPLPPRRVLPGPSACPQPLYAAIVKTLRISNTPTVGPTRPVRTPAAATRRLSAASVCPWSSPSRTCARSTVPRQFCERAGSPTASLQLARSGPSQRHTLCPSRERLTSSHG